MNDCDIKVIANKFQWKYLRQDKVILIRSSHDKSQSIASLQSYTEWVIFEPIRTHRDPQETDLEKPIFSFGCFSLKTVYNSCKLQRLLQVVKFLFMYSFTHTSIAFLFRQLPTEIVIFINFCYQMKCFSGDRLSFFRSRFF